MFGFKMWEVEIVIVMALMMFAGLRQHYLSSSGRLIRRRFSNKLYKVLAGIATIIFWGLLIHESSDSLLDYGLKSLGPEDHDAWSLFIAAFAAMVISGIFYGVMYSIGRVTAWSKKGFLLDVQKDIL